MVKPLLQSGCCGHDNCHPEAREVCGPKHLTFEGFHRVSVVAEVRS